MSKLLNALSYLIIGYAAYEVGTILHSYNAKLAYANHLKEHEIDVLQAINLHLHILAESVEADQESLNVPDDMEGLGVE